MNVLRNKKIFKIFLESVNNKDKKTSKQKFYDYSREIAIENVEKTTKLCRTKLTFKKKIIVLLLRHLRTRKDCIKSEIIAFTSRWFSRESFWIQKNLCFNAKKVLLIQNDKKYKRIRKELRYVLTHENVTSLFLRQIFVVIHINAIVNENFNEFYNRIFFKLLW